MTNATPPPPTLLAWAKGLRSGPKQAGSALGMLAQYVTAKPDTTRRWHMAPLPEDNRATQPLRPAALPTLDLEDWA